MPARQKERSATTGLDARRLYEAVDCERQLRDMTAEELAAERLMLEIVRRDASAIPTQQGSMGTMPRR